MGVITVLDLKYFHKKQKAPENPLRLIADRQSAIQCKNCTLKFFNIRLINETTN